MATKLKNMKLSSVDLVKAGANQEADICLYKSAETEEPAQEATEAPTEAEKNIFKRFLGWLHESLTDFDYEPESPIEKGDDIDPNLEPADIYKSAIIESIQSIAADETLSDVEKSDMIEESLTQYHEKMVELAKINHNHDALGRFASGSSGGGRGPMGSDVRNFGVPGHSGSYHMNSKEKKLAQQIIDNEELELEVKDGTDALGNTVTNIHGTREDYGTFKEMWNMVAPSTVGKSDPEYDLIEEI